jgi:hypothetical protein
MELLLERCDQTLRHAPIQIGAGSSDEVLVTRCASRRARPEFVVALDHDAAVRHE